jgi:hypothetical protein
MNVLLSKSVNINICKFDHRYTKSQNKLLVRERALIIYYNCMLPKQQFSTFQIQFTSNRLSNDMFKISNGVVEGLATDTRGLLTESIQFDEHDGRNDNIEFRSLNPDGYM